MKNIHVPNDFHLDCLMIALQRTASTAVSQAICSALEIDHNAMDQYYSYNLMDRTDLNMNDAIQVSPNTGQSFFFYNFLGYKDESDKGTLPTFTEITTRADKILILERNDALTHALSMRLLHIYSRWRKEQESSPDDFFHGMKDFIDQGLSIEKGTLEYYERNSVSEHDMLRKRFGSRATFVNYYNLFHKGDDGMFLEELRISKALDIPTPKVIGSPSKHTNPQTLTNHDALVEHFGRTFKEQEYWRC